MLSPRIISDPNEITLISSSSEKTRSSQLSSIQFVYLSLPFKVPFWKHINFYKSATKIKQLHTTNVFPSFVIICTSFSKNLSINK